MRLFVALHLTEATRAVVARVGREWQRYDTAGDVRWVDDSRIHLTLAFLGEVPEEQLEPIIEALDRGLASTRAPRLATGETGAFPNRRHPRVLWIGLREEGDRLGPLQQAVVEALRPFGFEPEKRAYKPHLTLGRVREEERGRPRTLAPRLLEQLGAPVECASGAHDRVALVRSYLSRSGSRYEDVRVWTLGSS
jgi:2'-5' RNA ligase